MKKPQGQTRGPAYSAPVQTLAAPAPRPMAVPTMTAAPVTAPRTPQAALQMRSAAQQNGMVPPPPTPDQQQRMAQLGGARSAQDQLALAAALQNRPI